MLVLSWSAGIGRLSCLTPPSFVLFRWTTFGGIAVVGMLLFPSSKRACVAILTLFVSVLYQRIGGSIRDVAKEDTFL